MLTDTLKPILLPVVALVFCTGQGLSYEPDAHMATQPVPLGEVAQCLPQNNWTFVDTRPTDHFNGWPSQGMKRGGHLPGAVDFPATWVDSPHQDRARILSAALQAKRIAPDRNIVLYGPPHSRNKVAEYLRNAGFARLYHFDFLAWTKDNENQLQRYPNYHLLVPASIVKRLLDGERPHTFERTEHIKFVEVSWGMEDASYAKGHVPGSFHVNTDHFEPPPTWKLGDPATLRKFAKRYGFQAADTVIISGEDPTASYRLAIVLRYMGLQDVRVLNGGFAAWKAANYQVETTSTQPPKTQPFEGNLPARGHLVDNLQQVQAGLQASDRFTLVDTRTWDEFIGKTTGYTYHSHKGRIPGSLYGQANFQGANSLTPYRNIDNTMRNAAEIRRMWTESGIDTKKQLSFFCGGGWRAAEVLTFAHVMGINNASLYSDGWIGWSNEQQPVQTGTPKTPQPAQNHSAAP